MNDLFSLFRDFYDKPDKAQQLLLSLLKVFLICVFSHACYVRYVGNYHLLSMTDIAGIYKFIIHGDWLVVVLTVALVSFMLFWFFPYLLELLNAMTGWIPVKQNNEGLYRAVNWILLKFKMMGPPPTGGGPHSWAKRSADMLDVLGEWHSDGGARLDDLKSSFLSQGFYLALLFAISYFNFSPFQSALFNILLVGICAAMIALYFYLSWIIRILSTAAEPYYRYFRIIELRQIVDETIQSTDFLQPDSGWEGRYFFWEYNYNLTGFQIVVFPESHTLRKSDLLGLQQAASSKNKPVYAFLTAAEEDFKQQLQESRTDWGNVKIFFYQKPTDLSGLIVPLIRKHAFYS